MSNPERYLYQSILEDLRHKMVFIGGPRQVGKTTLAQMIGKAAYKNPSYLNWDYRENRKKIFADQFKSDADLVIFDEIHKYKSWKNFIKGQFDTHKNDFDILVTGSARLDLYRRGGDSLMGRYHHYRLHPFSASESLGLVPALRPLKALGFEEDSAETQKTFKNLLTFGGFPEPYLKKDARTLRRFHREKLDRLVREDIRDVESIRDLSALDIMTELLPQKVGSLFSLNSLRENLGVTHKTLSHWADILERFYYHYRIYPYSARPIRSLRKEPKLYLWDWSQVENEAARLENLVASHLLKTVHFLQDREGYKTDLHFVRDVAGREMDFLVTMNRKPWFGVEVKSQSQDLTKGLGYFKTHLKIPWVYQVIATPGVDFTQKGIRVMSAGKFLTGLV